MICIYVFPIDEENNRNMADSELVKAYHEKKIDVERYTLHDFIEAINDDVIHFDNHWVKMIDDNAGYYSIASVHIDDLKEEGFDVSDVTEDDMQILANFIITPCLTIIQAFINFIYKPFNSL